MNASNNSGVNNSVTNNSGKFDVSIITSAHQVSDARLHRIALALVNSGLRCEVIAPGKSQDAPQGVRYVRAPFSRNFVGRVLRDLTISWKAQGKVVICLAPDLLPMARISTRLRHQFFAVDLFEDYLDLLNDRKWAQGIAGSIGKVIARTAIAIAKKADLLTVADEQVRPFNSRKRIVLKNLPSLSMLPDRYITHNGGTWKTTGSAFVRNEKPTAIYIGDIRQSRGLGMMLELAEKNKDWKFIFIGNTSEGDRERITVHPNIEYTGPQSPQDSWKVAIGAWVGLSLLEPTPAFIKAIPSKLYEYAAVGLPVLSTQLPRPVKLISEAGNGWCISTTEQADGILKGISGNPGQIDQLASNGVEWICEFLNSDTGYQEFVATITAALKP
jgi:glycosyltransferase involved in cell wall biosynthesis